MPQAPKPTCLIHLCSWEISPFSLLALWGNENCPPYIKVKQIEIFLNKMSLKGCKRSSLNAPGTLTPLSHSLLGFGDFPFSALAIWGNKNWPPSLKVKQMGLNGPNGPKGMQILQFKYPRHPNPPVSFFYGVGRFTLSHY